jgi:hypothetical protein
MLKQKINRWLVKRYLKFEYLNLGIKNKHKVLKYIFYRKNDDRRLFPLQPNMSQHTLSGRLRLIAAKVQWKTTSAFARCNMVFPYYASTPTTVKCQ